MRGKIHFDSDYMVGAHPAVMQRLVETNMLDTVGYGDDEFTASARELIKKACATDDVDVWLTIGGTQTNTVVIDALLHRAEGVIATEVAHINVHEAGAIEAGGHKVIALPSSNGKLTAQNVRHYIENFYADDTWQHMVAPGMVYITHPTEFGTLYTLNELQALNDVCREFKIPLFLDGARLGYGLTADCADVTLPDIARLCDAFYIGGTKCGAMFGEAIVARKGLLPRFFPILKQHGAVLAKGRMLGIQFETLFRDGLYQQICRHGVEMAMRLRRGFEQAGYAAAIDSPTNQQFFTLPNSLIDRLRETASFEYWGTRGAETSTVRFVTSWATPPDSITHLLNKLNTLSE